MKLEAENIASIALDADDARFYCKVRCTQCGERSDEPVYLTAHEEMELPTGRDTANLVYKCKLCERVHWVKVVEVAPASEGGATRHTLSVEEDEYARLAVFECRGVELEEWEPRGNWIVRSSGGSEWTGVDLSEEWSEYDERADAAVGVYEVESKFEIV